MIPLKVTDVGGGAGEIREWSVGDTLPVSLGGTGAVDAAAARTNLGLGSAAVAAILGTVSQSGGVPTGAIVQRGSNANGEFVRFADGTQILFRYWTEAISVPASSTVSLADWVLPASSPSTYFGTMTPLNTNADVLKGSLVIQSALPLTPKIRNLSGAAISGTYEFGALVLSRWF
ncbi:hypothetical protein [Diaphorobacter caeni]|uniref:hypothetical protein n=1 Tax=Diaphorobacter caeni TaxID=2784387 RepID=UPI00188FB347|nr:hypothetical protein [Diaphorobacter caeni]MBF5006833.1 hypothetical protein [Diaphorobacter caeni]